MFIVWFYLILRTNVSSTKREELELLTPRLHLYCDLLISKSLWKFLLSKTHPPTMNNFLYLILG